MIDLLRIARVVGGKACQQLEQERPEAVVVDLIVVALLEEHLRSHVFRRTAEGKGQEIVCHVGSGEPEVCELDVAIGVYEDVLGLYVSVDDLVLVEVVDGEANLAEVELGLVLGHALDFLELLEEFSAGTVLQAEADPVFGFENAEQAAEEWMLVLGVSQVDHNVALILDDLKFIVLGDELL